MSAQEQFANAAVNALASGMTNIIGSLTVNSPALFPLVPQFRILIDSELMLVTAVTGSTFTVSRGIEGTSAAVHSAGATVTHIITAGAINTALGGQPLQRGTATLVAGTVTVSGVVLTASSTIQITRNTPAGTLGNLSAPAASRSIGAGTFVINSSSGNETSTCDWLVIG